jgi:hypothetical protein
LLKRGACAERGVDGWHEVRMRDGLVALALPSRAACAALADGTALPDNVAQVLIDYAGQLRRSCAKGEPRVRVGAATHGRRCSGSNGHRS